MSSCPIGAALGGDRYTTPTLSRCITSDAARSPERTAPVTPSAHHGRALGSRPADTTARRPQGVIKGLAQARLVHDPGDGLQRDRQPARPVPRLVAGLVDGLVELVGLEQMPGLARLGA